MSTNQNNTIIHIPLKHVIIICVLILGGPTAVTRLTSFALGESTVNQRTGIKQTEQASLIEHFDRLDKRVDEVDKHVQELSSDVSEIKGALWDGQINRRK